MICILGDIHFRDDKDYFVNVCESFLMWYKNWKNNSSDNILILLGDLVDKTLLTGRVADYLERFIKYSNFKRIHIIVGNHDIKRQNGVEQLAYQFYDNKKDIIIHSHIESFDEEGKTILALPHFNGENEFGKNLVEFYSSLYEMKAYKRHYDLAVGHFNCDDISYGASSGVSNLEKLDVDKIILGHVHCRKSHPERYLGSVFASKIDENDDNRACYIIDENNSYEEKLPKFCEFLNGYYPDDLPISTALVPVYTIYNCSTESIAKEKYGDIFIRKTLRAESDFKIIKDKSDDVQNISNSFNIKEIMNSLLDKRMDLSQSVKDICNRVVV